MNDIRRRFQAGEVENYHAVMEEICSPRCEVLKLERDVRGCDATELERKELEELEGDAVQSQYFTFECMTSCCRLRMRVSYRFILLRSDANSLVHDTCQGTIRDDSATQILSSSDFISCIFVFCVLTLFLPVFERRALVALSRSVSCFNLVFSLASRHCRQQTMDGAPPPEEDFEKLEISDRLVHKVRPTKSRG